MTEEFGEKGPTDAESPHPGSSAEERLSLTPEQRRFLGRARSLHDEPSAADDVGKATPTENLRTAPRRPEHDAAAPNRRPHLRPSHAFEKQTMALVMCGLIVLAITFYVGKKFDPWKYALTSRSKANILAAQANKFPGVSAEELVDQALVAERLGNWEEAAERYVAAKYKNLLYSGILSRAGKLYYDHGAFDAADKLFDRSIAFGENIDSANYYRGMIALGREDFAAAERFFESAANAAPFNADYLYSWAETLRKDQRSKEAPARYQQAALRGTEQEAVVCRFKARMATVETGEIEQLSAELENKRREGPLSTDWLMTAAALEIRAGNISEAVRLVEQARAADRSLLLGLFAACAGDRLFSTACERYSELAQACKIDQPPPHQPAH